jgi:2-dehydro-3-deoxyphosphogluconate aldolase/(4S)-4-hydroxy-2-oxoglutarate aldolase
VQQGGEVTEATARPAIPVGVSAGGVVAIGRRIAPDAAPAIAEALAAGGVLAFELTLNDPEADALRAIESAATAAAGLGTEIGAGTVLSVEAAGRAVDAGATFLVMPHLDPAIVSWAAQRGIPAFPGCATPTEVFDAWQAGAAGIKVFPASSLGPSFVRELRGPFPAIPLVPTGGVTLETVPAFIAAGAVAVGLGGWLVGDGQPAGIRERSAAVTAAVTAARAAALLARRP